MEDAVEMMMRRKLVILGVSEMRMMGKGRTIHENYVLIYKRRADSTQHGVAFLVSSETADRI